MRRTPALLLLASLAACGPTDEDGDGIEDGVRKPDNVSLVAPSTPKGSVSGQVLTTKFTPLAGAQVTLLVGVPGEDGPRTLQTDAAGEFHFALVPAGAQVQVTIGKEGFGTARHKVTVPSSAGNFPINHGNASVGPLALTELNGQLRLQVITHSGRPAKAARAVVQASPASVSLSEFGTFGSGQGAIVVEATADETGLVTFNGVPGALELARLSGRYDVHVFPVDENGDGIVDAAGSFQTYSGQAIATDPSPRLIVLADAGAPGPLDLLASNVPSFGLSGGTPPNQNFLKAGESIHLVFNQALADKSVLAQLTDEHSKQSLSVATTVALPGNVLILTPSSTIEAGREYNVTVRVASAATGSFFDATGYFFGGDPWVAIPPGLQSIQYQDQNSDGQLTNGESVFINLTVPVGLTKGVGGLQAFINFDLNGSGSIGDGFGETGNANGFAVQVDEPLGFGATDKFPVKASGYTTRLRFTYFGFANVPNQINVRASFDKLTSTWGEYQTIWAEPVTKEMLAGMTLMQ